MLKSVWTQNRRSNLFERDADLRDRVGGCMLDRVGSCCASRRRIEAGACADGGARARTRGQRTGAGDDDRTDPQHRKTHAGLSSRCGADVVPRRGGQTGRVFSHAVRQSRRRPQEPAVAAVARRGVGRSQRGLHRHPAARRRSRLRQRRGHAGAPVRRVVLDSGVPGWHRRARPQRCVDGSAAHARGASGAVPAAVARVRLRQRLRIEPIRRLAVPRRSRR